ncbi:MAG: DUF1295 domain-containing protein [Anaerolineales bacterium]
MITLTYLTAGVIIWLLMTLLWLWSLYLKDTSIVDTFWGFGFVVTGWVYFALNPSIFEGRKILIMLLVFIWGMRLTIHIYLRNRDKGEDYRYRAWREEAGDSWWWKSYFKVFMLQGLIMWIVSLPLFAAQTRAQPSHFTVLDILGTAVWGIGFYFEAIGDYQLAEFKSKPENEGKLFTSGLWRYTRHPNYFGDAVQWWGFYLIAANTWFGAATIISPLLMTYLLIRVSGVALLEKDLAKNKPGYEEYMEKTNAFFPWFPEEAEKEN